MQDIKLSNEKLEIGIHFHGAELSFIRSKDTGTEFLLKVFRQKSILRIFSGGQEIKSRTRGNVSVYIRPEDLWGYDVVASAYHEQPEISAKRIYEHIQKLYPQAAQKQIKTLMK